jgi:hypothetical protein
MRVPSHPDRPRPPSDLPGPTGRDRREGEQAISYWETKLAEFGEGLTISALDITNTDTRAWSNRFLISVDPLIERSALVMYGQRFANLLGLPREPRTDVALLRQLPSRYGPIFLDGCRQAQQEWAPVRLEGEIGPAADGRMEQYRVVFIPIGVRPNALTCFAFGAFTSRFIELSPTATPG